MTWATAAEIAAMLDTTPGNVRVMAHREGWRRQGTRPQRYCLEDVFARRS